MIVTKKQIEHVLFLTGVGHLLSDRSYQNKHTEPSNVHSHTSFLPFLFAVPTIHAHAPVSGPEREPADYILVLFGMAGNLANLSSVLVWLLLSCIKTCVYYEPKRFVGVMKRPA